MSDSKVKTVRVHNEKLKDIQRAIKVLNTEKDGILKKVTFNSFVIDNAHNKAKRILKDK